MSLADKIRKAREKQVEVGGFVFTVRRPTDVEAMNLGGAPLDRMIDFVVGWTGVRELDALAGGDPHPLKFDAAVAREWLCDRPDLLLPLSDAIVNLYRDHAAALEAAKKN